MKNFVFYTFEGYTVSPTDIELDNLQILGFESGENSEEAIKILINNNSWIKKSGFDVNKIVYKELK